MFKKIWNAIVYVFGGQMAQDQLDAYVESRRPRNEAERLRAIRDYCRIRGTGL